METDEVVTLYEAIKLKKTSFQTIKAAIKNGQLQIDRLAPVGKTRKLELIRRSELDKWTPGTDSSIQRAATILGISFEEAKRLKAASKGS